MFNWVAISVLAAVAVQAGTAQAPAAASAPKWLVEDDGFRCSLMREVGLGTPVTLVLRADPYTEQADLMIVSKVWQEKLPARPIDVSLQLDGVPNAISTQAWSDRLGNAGQALKMDRLPADMLDRFSNASGLRIFRKDKPVAVASFSQSKAAVQALRSCGDDMLRLWGVDPQQRKGLKTFATWVPPKARRVFIKRLNIPESAIMRQASQTTILVFDVAADGSTSNCKIVAATKAIGLADECQELSRRGKYQPAISLAGAPVASRKVELRETTVVEATTVED